MKCCAKDCELDFEVNINEHEEFKDYKEIPLCMKHYKLWLTAEPKNANDAIKMVIELGDETPVNPRIAKFESLVDILAKITVESLAKDPIN